MNDSQDVIELALYHDVLCGWSAVADLRLRRLVEELDGRLRLDHRPFAIHQDDRRLTLRDIQAEARALREVAKEPETRGFRRDLWRGGDPPSSSLPPLIALEAARIIGGNSARDRLLAAMREAAFRHSLNISREDILIELAERCCIDIGRFTTALGSKGTRRLVIDQHEEASFRGIVSVPTVVIGGEWLISGAQSLGEYRRLIREFGEESGLLIRDRMVH